MFFMMSERWSDLVCVRFRLPFHLMPGGLGYAIILWWCYVKFYLYFKWNVVTASVTLYRYEVCDGEVCVVRCVMVRCVW